MSALFDPYREWLGIPPTQQPPNHYQLLGLPLYEGDSQLIRRAEEQRVAQVRARAGDDQQHLARQIANELAVARDCLLNTALKPQYDARLRASGARATPTPPPVGPPAPPPTPPADSRWPPSKIPRAIPVSPKPAEDRATTSPASRSTDTAADAETGASKKIYEEVPVGLPEIDVSAPARIRRPGPSTGPGTSSRGALSVGLPGLRRATRGARVVSGNAGRYSVRPSSPRQSPTPWLVAGGGVGVILLFLLIAAINSGKGPVTGKPRTHPSTQVTKRSRPKQSSNRVRRRSPRGSWRGGTPPPSGPRTFEDLLADTGGAPENNTVTGQLTAARRAMSERELDKAHARLHAALDLARSPYELAEARRVEKLLSSLEKFWRAVHEEANTLRSAQELQVGDEYIILSEARDGVLTFRYAGRFVQYRPLEMPAKLAIALAERRLKPDRPESHLHVGSFLAIDARGDRQEARRRWEQAGEAGAELLPELRAGL